jgi:hypothetical protein
MDTDEKNKFASISNAFDPDMNKDKYDEAKHDKQFQQSHKRNKNYMADITDNAHPTHTQHDPYNIKHQKAKKQGLNVEEEPTDKDILANHHHTGDDKHHEFKGDKFIVHNESKHQQHINEVVQDKRGQYPQQQKHGYH